MASIFISYRHSDCRTAVAWIRETLAQRYGADSVFEYQHHAEPSRDFRKVIGRAIRRCDVVLAVIGQRWLGDGQPAPKIQEANDWVRIELETAIQLDLPVIPVLVEDAAMPTPQILPDSLRDFSFLTAVTVDTSMHFARDMDALAKVIDRHAPAVSSPMQPRSSVPPTPPPPGNTQTETAPGSKPVPAKTGRKRFLDLMVVPFPNRPDMPTGIKILRVALRVVAYIFYFYTVVLLLVIFGTGVKHL